jgi:hypothetical protein
VRRNQKEGQALGFGEPAEQRSVTAEAGLQRTNAGHLQVMIFAEIKPQIEQLPHDELLKAMAYLKHLLRAENPSYQRELAQRHADIEAGRGVSLTEAKQRLNHG